MSLINFNSSERDIFKGENLEFADGFSKVGNESLKWDYKNGESFSINTPVNFSFEKDPKNPQAEFSFAMYIGFKKNYEGKFTVAFQKDGMTCCWFNFYGGFVGWRYLRLLFEDMEGTPVCGMDSIKITAENDGEIFFNEMITANYSDVRLTTPSYQIPTIKSKYTSGIMTRGELKATYEPATFDDSVIRERLKKYVICEYGKNINAKLAMEKFLSINIVEIEKGIFQGNKMEYMSQRAMLDNTDGEKVQYITLRTCTDLARDLAITYIKTEDAEYKKAYILLLKYLMFCGISEGSAVGVHHLLDYSLKPLYMSIAVMYKEIEAENLGDEVSRFCRWFTHVNKRGFLEGQELLPCSADDFNNGSLGMMMFVCFIEERALRSRWFFAIKSWIDFNMKYSQNLLGVYKEDGSIYHHCGHYPAYGMCGLNGVIPVVYSMSGTPYEISDESWNNTKNVMSTMRFYASKYSVPVAFSGRHPVGELKIDLIPFKYLALAGIIRGDAEVISIYLRLMEKPYDELDERIIATNIKPEPTPNGNKSLYMACAMLHRRDEWLVVMKGFSKYLWGNESYASANLYGRYRSYGNIEIVEKSLKDSGFVHEGFDFRRFSGVTSIIPPLNEFKENVLNLDKDSGFEEMLISDQAFSGGVSDGKNGMFSMILSEHPKYNGTHFAIKTGIFVDDFILLIGSNISNDSKYPTETTLFQNYVGDKTVNDDMADVLGNIYYTDDKNVYVKTSEQISQSSTGSGETKGRFKRCGISHGVSPSHASYEYSIGMKGAKKEDYEIIQQDDIAHIVAIKGLVFMSIFKPNEFCGYKDVTGVDIPVLIMIDEKGDISICNPDLGLYDIDRDSYDENGVRREVSLYSRKWIYNTIQSKSCNLTIADTDIKLILLGGKTYKIERNR